MSQTTSDQNSHCFHAIGCKNIHSWNSDDIIFNTVSLPCIPILKFAILMQSLIRSKSALNKAAEFLMFVSTSHCWSSVHITHWTQVWGFIMYETMQCRGECVLASQFGGWTRQLVIEELSSSYKILNWGLTFSCALSHNEQSHWVHLCDQKLPNT